MFNTPGFITKMIILKACCIRKFGVFTQISRMFGSVMIFSVNSNDKNDLQWKVKGRGRGWGRGGVGSAIVEQKYRDFQFFF